MDENAVFFSLMLRTASQRAKSMAFDLNPYLHRIRTIPPHCLASFHCQFDERSYNEFETNGIVHSSWKLSCTCGHPSGHIFGYVAAGYDSHFLGPLTFQCSECGERSRIIDTATHGFSGELRSESPLPCGCGEPEEYTCPSCLGKSFEVSCVFIIPDATFHIVEDDVVENSGLGYGEMIENLFDLFSAECFCVACKARSLAASFELK